MKRSHSTTLSFALGLSVSTSTASTNVIEAVLLERPLLQGESTSHLARSLLQSKWATSYGSNRLLRTLVEENDQRRMAGAMALTGIFASCVAVVLLRPTPPPSRQVALASSRASSSEGEGLQAEPSVAPRALLSSFRLCALAALQLSYGFTCAVQGLLLAPLEVKRLWPENASMALGALAVIVGVAQLVGPEAGHYSDGYRCTLGRRRPLLIITTFLFWTFNVCLWWLSLLGMPWMFMFFILLQQVALNVIFAAQGGLVPDLVAEEQWGFAGGASAASVLVGALLGFAAIHSLSDWDYHLIYPLMSLIAVSCCVVVCIAAQEESSETRQASNPTKMTGLRRILANYMIDARRHHNFIKLLISKTLYCAAVIMKCFMLYFCQDTFRIHNESLEKVLLSEFSLAAELTGAITAVVTMFLLDRGSGSARRGVWAACLGSAWMGALWFGPPYMAWRVGQARGTRSFETALSVWRVVILVGTAAFGAGQGLYLAGDQALNYALVPSREEASRYLGFNSLCCCVGASLGGIIAGGLLAGFGNNSFGGYTFHGYTAIFVFAALLSFGIALIAGFIRPEVEGMRESSSLAERKDRLV